MEIMRSETKLIANILKQDASMQKVEKNADFNRIAQNMYKFWGQTLFSKQWTDR